MVGLAALDPPYKFPTIRNRNSEGPAVSEPILSHAFPNGLVLVAEPMRSLQSAAFTFLTPAGCVFDPPARSGLSGLACEMMLRGSGERDGRQFIFDLDGLGVERHEGVANAHASYNGATLAENLPAALAIYADLLRRPHLPEEQLEACRQVALQDLRAVEDEPAEKVLIELRRGHYPHPWGRPAQGELEALEAASLDDVRLFFQRHYMPNGTILGVAGRIDWEPLVDLVGRLLGDWRPHTLVPVLETSPGQRRRHIPYDSKQTHIGIAYASVPYRHPDYFQAWGAVGVLSGGMSARLFTEVREKRGLCYSVHASCHTLRDLGAVFCYAGTSAQRAQETLDVTLGELRRLAAGVEDHELDRLKARIKSALIMQQESSSAPARRWPAIGITSAGPARWTK